VKVDAHPFKGIHWRHTSTYCFTNSIRQIYGYSLHCTKKV